MTRTGNALRLFLSRHRSHRLLRSFSTAVLGANFPTKAHRRLLIMHHPTPISWSLVHPYFHYANDFEAQYGLSIRTRPVEDFLSGKPLPDSDIIVLQPWFTESSDRISDSLSRYRKSYPDTRIIFLDAYAHTDLRLAKILAPYVDLYLRKARFHNQDDFYRAWAGDTNLTDYYSRLYNIPAEQVDWQVPDGFTDRLDLVPNFLTAPYLLDGFLGMRPDFTDRPIDVHSRLATKGSDWYQAMRQDADRAIKDIKGIRLTPNGRIPQDKFLNEMRRSKLCWSPFGYGELCWRDLEAFLTGAVLVKPDMSHLETAPDLYIAGESYLPVKWDFSDLSDVVQGALADPENTRRIAENAFQVCHKYLISNRFVAESARQLGLDR